MLTQGGRHGDTDESEDQKNQVHLRRRLLHENLRGTAQENAAVLRRTHEARERSARFQLQLLLTGVLGGYAGGVPG